LHASTIFCHIDVDVRPSLWSLTQIWFKGCTLSSATAGPLR
jgi:hypothetical protein